jgi:hypothetical protein
MGQPLNAGFVPDRKEMARCFLGEPRRELLPFAYQLYRFNSGAFDPKGRITAWWSSVRGVAPGDGLDALRERAAGLRRHGSGFASAFDAEAGLARASVAVSLPWNDMSTIVRARLNREAFAWVGRARSQLYDDGRADLGNVRFIGGGWQIYLPNLTGDDLLVLS